MNIYDYDDDDGGYLDALDEQRAARRRPVVCSDRTCGGCERCVAGIDDEEEE